jgi:hypothetical protein
VRQVGPPSPFNEISVPTYVRTCTPSAFIRRRVSGFPSSEDRSRSERKDVRALGREFLLRNFDQPDASGVQQFHQSNRDERGEHQREIVVDGGDERHEVHAGLRPLGMR